MQPLEARPFEVGAKVRYEGREMTVVKRFDDKRGDINVTMLDMSAVFALAAALPEAKSLRSLKCAAASP